MFNRRFVFEFSGDEDPEMWEQPGGPEMGRRGWPHLRSHLRRFIFGHGPFGPEDMFFGTDGPFGGEGEDVLRFVRPGKRYFGRGDLKYALLELLQEQPMHGYEMMKALQERTGGMYSASPGSVYPTLQMLEDRGFVTVSETDGKKVYTITDEGRAFLAEGRDEERGPAARQGRLRPMPEVMHEIAALAGEIRALQPMLGLAFRNAVSDPKKLKRLRKLVAKLRAELEALAEGRAEE